MPGMSDHILTAPVFKRLSDQSRVPGFHKTPILGAILADLKGGAKSVLDVAYSAGMYADRQQAKHLEEDWFDSKGQGFWHQTKYDVPALVRGGMVKALELYQATGKPLDFFWMISGDDTTDPWNVLISECTEHIVVIFFTPNVPCNLPMVDDYTMWVVEQDNANNIVTRHTKRPVG